MGTLGSAAAEIARVTRRDEIGQVVVLSIPISMIDDKASLRRSLRGPVDLGSAPVTGMRSRSDGVVENDPVGRDLPAGRAEGMPRDGHVAVPGRDLILSLARVGTILRAEASFVGSGDPSPFTEEWATTLLADAFHGSTASTSLDSDEPSFAEAGRVSVSGIAWVTGRSEVRGRVVVVVTVQVANDDAVLVGSSCRPAQRCATPVARRVCRTDRVVEHHAASGHHAARWSKRVLRSLQISGHRTSVAQYTRCVSYSEMG